MKINKTKAVFQNINYQFNKKDAKNLKDKKDKMEVEIGPEISIKVTSIDCNNVLFCLEDEIKVKATPFNLTGSVAIFFECTADNAIKEVDNSEELDAFFEEHTDAIQDRFRKEINDLLSNFFKLTPTSYFRPEEIESSD